MKKLSLSIVVLFVCYSLSFAQEKEKTEFKKTWEIGLNLGVQRFTGEYNTYKPFLEHYKNWTPGTDFGMGALLRKNYSQVFAMELSWNFTNLTGTNWNRTSLAIPHPSSFKTGIGEFDLNTVWNINNLFAKNKFDRKAYLFAKVGYGFTHIAPKTGANSTLPNLTIDDRTHWQPLTLPLGAGIAFRLSNKLKLDIGTQWTWTNTDRYDGVALDNDPTVKKGHNLADVSGTKLYTYAGLRYNFGTFAELMGKKKKPEPVVIEKPKPQPKPEPKPEPKKEEPKPEIKVIKPAVIGNIYKVYFAFDKWDINSQAASDLDRLVADMTANPAVKADLKSHTDSMGPASYNMKLSEKRSKSVIDYLVKKGIALSRINAQAFGETKLTNKCSDGVPCTAAEHQANRRTETIVIE